MSPLAITGMTCISGFGLGSDVFQDGMINGRTALEPVAFVASEARARIAGTIRGFDPSQFILPAKLRRIDRAGQLAVASARLLLEDAALVSTDALDCDRLGIVLGSTTAGLHTLVPYVDGLINRGVDGGSAMDFSNTVGNAAASLCGIELGWRGPNVTLNYKEASAAAAIAYASSLLHNGQADAVMTGGVEDIEVTYFRVHDSFNALARDTGQGEASRPFDRRRNGFVLGTGSFVLLLETLASAERRAARSHGQLVGIGATAGSCPLNAWPTDPGSLARCMRNAIASAERRPADVAVVFASANSTPVLDRTEAAALEAVFGPGGVPVVAIKGALGESGAVTAAAVQVALQSLRTHRLPPTVGFSEPDDDCRVDVAAVARALPDRPRAVALINSFASGGTNYSLVVRA